MVQLSPRSLFFAVASAALLSGPAAARDAARHPDLAPCPEPFPAPDALCGRLEVPEDPGTPGGRTIGLAVVVLPATSGGGASDAMTFLPGDAGVPATELAPAFARLVPRIREHRDVVLVDRRGTGGSNPLHCPEAEALPAETPSATRAARCLEEVRAVADPRRYGDADAAADLEVVRRSLGIGQWDLWAVGQGTRTARAVLRRDPDRVRAAVLFGATPLAREVGTWPSPEARGVLDRLLSRCAIDADCAAAWPGALGGPGPLLERLAREPARPELPAREPGGVARPVALDAAAAERAIFQALRSIRTLRVLPSILDAAVGGNYAPLAALRPEEAGPPPGPRGLEAALACAESAADAAACPEWLREERSEELRSEPRAAGIPVLVLSGAEDPIAPPSAGAEVAVALGGVRHLVLPDRSHDDVDPCVADLVQDVVLTASTDRLDLACLRRPLGAFRAAPGLEQR